MSKRNSHRNGSFGGRQSERKKKLRQFGQEELEIHLERPSFPPAAAENPTALSIEAHSTGPNSDITTPEVGFLQLEIAPEGSLSYQPNKPGGLESR